MVKSLLNSTINYPEIKKIENEDIDFESTSYGLTLFGMEVTVALGQPKYDFLDKEIVFYPLYLIKDEKVNMQIGIYEVIVSEIPKITDADGDIILNIPLLYTFVNKRLIETVLDLNLSVSVTSLSESNLSATSLSESMPEQSASTAFQEQTEFKNDADKKGKIWIQKYMKNNNFAIEENEGRGDCLFAAIRDGLAQTDRHLSVADMRKILADNATEELFESYKIIYEQAKIEQKQLMTELKQLTARHKELEKSKERANIILALDADIKKKHNELKGMKKSTQEILNEFTFMAGVNTLNDFKEKIQTCEFYGETWSISTLERVLNIKLILLSEEIYKHGDTEQVLQCGQLNDSVLEEAGKFEPKHYILVNHQGHHYQLITYRARKIFTFTEIPYAIKMLVVDKCLERQAGPYYIIPDFRDFLAVEASTNAAANAVASETANAAANAKEKANASTNAAENASANAAAVELQSDLYNNATVFQFYYKSVDKPVPGAGAGEIMGPEGVKEYDELKKIPSWRKKLSNYWIAPFILDGHSWQSVEHYYQGSKFKRNHPDFYLQFSLDSNSELAKDPAMAEGAGGKTGKYQGKEIRPKNIKIDEDFFSSSTTSSIQEGRGVREMENAMRAKFTQNEELKRLLKATKKAKLQHFTRGNLPIVFNELMRIRKEL